MEYRYHTPVSKQPSFAVPLVVTNRGKREKIKFILIDILRLIAKALQGGQPSEYKEGKRVTIYDGRVT